MPHKSKSMVMVPLKGVMATRMATAKTQVVVVQKKGKKTKKSRRKIKTISTNRMDLLSIYRNCLVDPFEFPPIRLGYDTFVPTSVHTAYARQSFVASNGDGSFDIVICPNLSNFLFINTAGNTMTPSWTLQSAINANAIKSQIDSSRTISMGVRIYPQIALTSAPGLVTSGVTPRCNMNDFVSFMGYNTNTRAGLPYNQFYLSRTGNTECQQVTWRPTDAKEFQFSDQSDAVVATVSGVVGTIGSAQQALTGEYDTGGSFLHISGQGLPVVGGVGTTVFIEAVWHIECTDSIQTVVTDTGDDSAPKLCTDLSVPDMQSAYRRIVSSLPTASEAVEAGTSFFAGQVGKAASAYATHFINSRTRGREPGYVNLV